MAALLAASTILALPGAAAGPTAEAPAGDAERVLAPGAAIRLAAGEPGAAVEAALGGGLLRPVAGPLTAPAESGDHWLAVAARDGAGNVSAVRWVRLRVDGEPPAMDLAIEPPPVAGEGGREWVVAGAIARASAVDRPAGVATTALAIGEGTAEAAGGEAVSAALGGEGGPVAVRAWAVDRVGNRSPEAARELWIDGEPPRGEIVAAGPAVTGGGGEGALIVAPGTAFAVRVEDSGSGVATVLHGADGHEVGAGGWAGRWSAGGHEVEALATDRVGNQARLGPLAFTVDAEPPALTWTVAAARWVEAGGARVFAPPVTVTVAADDALAGVERVEWSGDGAAWQTLAGALVTDRPALRFRVADRVGNVREAGASWPLDAEPPRLALVALGGDPVAPGGTVRLPPDGDVRVLGEDAGSGLGQAQQSIDGGSWLPLPPLPDYIHFRFPGRYRLRIAAEDRLGNATEAEWTVVVEIGKGGSDGR